MKDSIFYGSQAMSNTKPMAGEGGERGEGGKFINSNIIIASKALFYKF